MTEVTYPRSFIADMGGGALDSGSAYVGAENQDPQTNPITVYWDAALTQVAAQPLSISSGYIMHGGARAAVYAASAYSMRILNRSGSLVDYIASVQPDTLAGSKVSFTQSGSSFSQTVQDKLQQTASIKDFGATGSGTENSAVTQAEASSFSYIDLNGLTVTTTLTANSLTKHYFNGTLIALNPNGIASYVKNGVPVDVSEVGNARRKSPILNWSGRNVLWLGTSIPAYGFTSLNSYPELVGQALGFTVTNNCWAGSHVTYNVNGSSTDMGTVTTVGMTEDDRQAGLALYGSSSVYSDTYDPITKASQMTADYRVKAAFASAAYSVVVIDHNINDSRNAIGTLTPQVLTITGISKGVTTQVTFANAASLSVGGLIAMRVTGIAKLDYAAARVQSIASNTVTLNIDSSGFAGTFSSGTAVELDRNTVCGAYEFLIYYNYWCANLYGYAQPTIIMSGVVSNYEYNAFSNEYSSVGKVIKSVADKWGLSFFDIGYFYQVTGPDQLNYFPDQVHPTTLETRQALANQWAQWFQGGAVKTVNTSSFLGSSSTSYRDQREALYDDISGGFWTPTYIRGATSTVVTDDFADGDYVGWSTTGTAPTVVNAPWGAGKSVQCVSAASALSAISRAAVLDDVSAAQFDLYLPVVSGLVSPGTVGLVTVLRLDNSLGNPVYEVQLVVSSTGCTVRMGYWTTTTGGEAFVPLSDTTINAATKYTIGFTALKGAVGRTGAIKFLVNGSVVARQSGIANSTQTTPQTVKIGIAFTSIAAVTLHVGNVTISKAAVSDYSNRATGSFTAGANTVTVVNGIITAIA